MAPRERRDTDPAYQYCTHLRDNFRALDVELDPEDIDRIDAIDRQHRCEDPDWMEW